MQLAQQFVIDELVKRDVRTILADGVAPIRAHIAAGLAAEPALQDLGIEVVAVRVAAVAPTSELEKALQQPTREAIQQNADEATFRRRALAVEKERAIAENELQNRIELARREEELVAREGANARPAPRSRPRPRWSRRRPPTSAARWPRPARRRRSTRSRARSCGSTPSGRRSTRRCGADVLLALAAARAGRQARPDRAPDDHARHAHAGARAAERRRAMTLVPRCVLVERADGVPRPARASRHARAGAVLPRAARHARSPRSRSATCTTRRSARGVLGAIPPSWRTATVAARRPRSLPVRRRRHRRRARAGRAGRQRRQVPRRPAGDRAQPGARALPRRARQPAPGGDGATCAPTSPPAARAVQERTMVRAALDDGQELRALNEVFLGHRTHQSARYELTVGDTPRAPVLLRADRRHRDRRDRLGVEHQPPEPAAGRAARADRGRARVVRPRGVGEPDDRRDADRGAARRGRDAHGGERARRRRRRVRRRHRGRPAVARLGPARDDRRGRAAPAPGAELGGPDRDSLLRGDCALLQAWSSLDWGTRG